MVCVARHSTSAGQRQFHRLSAGVSLPIKGVVHRNGVRKSHFHHRRKLLCGSGQEAPPGGGPTLFGKTYFLAGLVLRVLGVILG